MNDKKTPENNLMLKFKDFVLKEGLWQKSDRILTAVSGGIDSVVMLHLLLECRMDCAVAHCNFGLRGEESDRDEKFVVTLAAHQGLPCYVKRFNTYEVAYHDGISVEMAARELRYQWFAELAEEHGFRFIVTGHHADDQIETFFLNLIRGTGISGLRGMLPKTGKILRPLLPFFREEIESYARTSGLSWVEDSTNLSTEIRRNQIRHNIIPLLESMNIRFRETLLRSMHHVREAEIIYRESVEKQLEPLISKDGSIIRISISGLKKLHPRSAFLFEFLSGYGFNRATVEAIDKSLEGLSGKQFASATHRVIKDRDHLMIVEGTAGKDEDEWHYLISSDETRLNAPLKLEFNLCKAEGFTLPEEPSQAALDYDRLIFPLTLRRWQHGDAFCPLGMKNRKKLSDFFSDLKLSVYDKENAYVLLSGNDLVWVVGFRIDHRYRVTRKSKRIFSIILHKD